MRKNPRYPDRRLTRIRKMAGFRRGFPGIPVALHIGVMTKERVDAVLGRIRPFMQADGGDIEVVDVHGNCAEVRLTGMCAGCPSAHMTLYLGVETALRDEIPEFETLRLV
jgi:Fe-S cluster biogenesis protein NfuA